MITGEQIIVKLSNHPCPLDIDPVAQVEICTVCMKGCFASDMFPLEIGRYFTLLAQLNLSL